MIELEFALTFTNRFEILGLLSNGNLEADWAAMMKNYKDVAQEMLRLKKIDVKEWISTKPWDPIKKKIDKTALMCFSEECSVCR